MMLLLWELMLAGVCWGQSPATEHFNRGIQWLNEGEPDKAIPEFTKAIELDPKMADAYYQRGAKTIEVGGDVDAAIRDLSKAIELDARQTDALATRGQAYEGRKEYDKAIADFSKYIALDPREQNGSALGYLGRGRCRMEKKDVAGAVADFTKAISLFPKSAEGYRLRALAHDKAGDKAKAEADRKMCKELTPR